MTMSDYIAVEHDAETGEETSRVLTQEEIDALMATFAGFSESIIEEATTSTEVTTSLLPEVSTTMTLPELPTTEQSTTTATTTVATTIAPVLPLTTQVETGTT